jgi:hypothetical protein
MYVGMFIMYYCSESVTNYLYLNFEFCLRFWVLTVVTMKYTIIWHVMPCNLVCRYQSFLLDYKKYTKQNGPGFAHPSFTFYTSCLPIEHMDLLSLVLCSIFVQSLDFQLELTSFDTFILSLFTA